MSRQKTLAVGRTMTAWPWIVGVAFLLITAGAAPAQESSDPAVLVRQLGEFRAAIDARIQSNSGQPMPAEQRRVAIYAELRTLGAAAVPALQRGLFDADVQVRRNVALFLSYEGGAYGKPASAALDLTPFLAQLTMALRDEDERVLALTAQAFAHLGPKAASAVPELVRLLGDGRDAVRNTACLGLAGIGPAARDALPALRQALNDPSSDVRRFAQRAIERIDLPAKP